MTAYSLLIASEYDVYSIIEKLSPYLAGSGSIVVHSPYAQPLIDLQAKLRSLPEWLAPNMTEAWLRQYQVLPGRTHPNMVMSGSGGYLLHAIKMLVLFPSCFLHSLMSCGSFDNPEASYTQIQRRNKAKKTEDSPSSDEPSTSVTISADAMSTN